MRHGTKLIKESELISWDNPCPDRDYDVNITFPEFTCVCPESGYPDFATIKISYVPGRKVVELKSLKLWLNRFRERAISHEASTNEIYDALKELLEPRSLEVVGNFNPRGNVHTVIRVSSNSDCR